MGIRVECLTIDAVDPIALGRWWAEALGWQVVEEEEDECVVRPPEGGSAEHGLAELLFGQVPEAKGSAGGTSKNRLHLDLRPDDQAAEVARFEALGARHADVGQTGDETWVVLADPEGNEFCILRARPATPS